MTRKLNSNNVPVIVLISITLVFSLCFALLSLFNFTAEAGQNEQNIITDTEIGQTDFENNRDENQSEEYNATSNNNNENGFDSINLLSNSKDNATPQNIDPGQNYIEFTSDKSFSLSAMAQTWDGTIYFYDYSKKTWDEWSGSLISSVSTEESGNKHSIRLCGLKNKEIMGSSSAYMPWQINADAGSVECKGDMRNLLQFNLDQALQPNMNSYCFAYMFFECFALKTAPDLSMSNLSESCYASMFEGCNYLEDAPSLAALNLKENCYSNMFAGCSKLSSAPVLEAGKTEGYLGNGCYSGMFKDCISLKNCPDLPCEDLTKNCYSNMFQGCKNLETTPELPAINLQDSCYSSMFRGCTSLLAPTDLNHLVSLEENCCNFMFKDCTAISVNMSKTGLYDKEWKISVQSEPSDWCKGIFDGTKGPFTGNPLIDTSYYVYQKPIDLLSMSSDTQFSVSANLSWNNIIQYSVDAVQWINWNGSKITSAGTGKQYLYFRGTGNTVITGQNGQAWNITGQNVICEGFLENLLDSSKVKEQQYPQMADYAFNNLFKGQTALIQAPELYSVTMTKGCYQSMFEGCSNLTKAPEIPATTLSDACYKNMFNGCSAITRVPTLACQNLAPSCYEGMFAGAKLIVASIDLPAKQLKESCYAGMFKGCEALLCPSSLSSVTSLAKDCCKEMYSGCSAMKVYTEPSGLYNVEWKVDADNADGWSSDMFKDTSGSFKGSPDVRTSYYVCQGPSNCITFTSDKPFSIYITKQWNGKLYYSVDASTWNIMSTGTIYSTLKNGSNVIYVRGTDNSAITGINGQQWKFYPSDGSSGISVSGNIENLLDYRRVEVQEHPVMAEGCFANMFKGCQCLLSAPELPSVKLATKCYYQMFKDCLALTESPDLPAQELAEGCYYEMFSGCRALITGPELSSTTLAPYCYYLMFNDCTLLSNSTKNLPATTLREYCYFSMFNNCESLETAPVLPKVELASNCFAYMFSGCESLNKAPDIDADESATNCCKYMFSGCSKIASAPRISVSTIEDSCFYGMFQNCSSLQTAPTLSCTSIASSCYQYMFAGCTSITNAPILPAMQMKESCYSYMFSGCSALEEVPSLPSSALAESCYDHMFENCSKITVTTSLPATVLATSCYSNMFLNCNSLIRPTDLSHVTQLAQSCCANMFKGCSLIKVYLEPFYDYTQSWKVQAQQTAAFWASGMFEGTTGKFTGSPELGKDYYVYKYEEGYITFTSREPFDVSANKNWDGSVYVSVDAKQWGQPWEGTKVSAVLDSSSNEYRLYFKGSNNSKITGNIEGESQPKWTISGNRVSVIGNIENLLDSKTVAEGKHPVMGPYCFANMFKDNESLILAPTLRANNLSDYCYSNMFNGCTSLSKLPALNAINLKKGCYQSMFEGCTSIVCPLDMSHVAYLDTDCCKSMYKGCSKIQIRKTEKAPYTNKWIVHGKLSGQAGNWSDDMFKDTMQQSEISTPEIDTTYYVLEQTDSYLTLSSIADFTMKRDFKCDGKVNYSYDGFNWKEWKDGETLDAELTEDDLYCIYVVGSNNTYVNAKNENDGGIVFESKVASPKTIGCTGNIECLLDYQTVSKKEHPIMETDCFFGLFRNCSLLDTAPEMLATSLRPGVYEQMYQNCTSLLSAPNLPATRLTSYCYKEMFLGCKALTYSPDLPSNNELAYECYFGMFSGCESLTKTPALPSTRIEYSEAYSYMFKDCKSLKACPSLPATVFCPSSYAYMFEGCSGITEMPELPCTSLKEKCYQGMFKDCVNLVKVKDLPASATESHCYDQMFKGCIKITDVPSLPAKKVSAYCYSEMFAGCTSLKTAPQLPATYLYEYCYNKMFEGCSSLVDAYSLPFSILADYCYFAMYKDCTSLQNAPELPTTAFVTTRFFHHVYASMFEGCKSLKNAPALPSQSLCESCYENMFKDCTSLETSPKLSASSLAKSCYKGMFSGCNSLTNAPKLSVSYLYEECYSSMFAGCTSLQYPPDLPAYNKLNTKCYYAMFEGCTSLLYCPELPSTSFKTDQGVACEYVYSNMFKGCKALTKTLDLPCTELQVGCYQGMFEDCTGLLECPELPATSLTDYCYANMFKGCTSVTKMPYLPALYTKNYCYANMFDGCSNLVELTSFTRDTSTGCFREMFKDCKSIVEPPSVSFIPSAKMCCEGMFQGCSKLSQPPYLSFDQTAESCCKNMFADCVSLKALPYMKGQMIVNPDSCSQMFKGCTNIKLYKNKPETSYVDWYSPESVVESSVTDMFKDTGGDSVDPIQPNATYYLASDDIYAILYKDGQLDIQIGNAADEPTHEIDETYPLNDFLGSDISSESDVPWHDKRADIKNVAIKTWIFPSKSVSYWFKNLSNCKTIQLNCLGTSDLTSMKELFYGCSSLESLDLTNFSTKGISSAENAADVFTGCTKLSTISLGENWNFSGTTGSRISGLNFLPPPQTSAYVANKWKAITGQNKGSSYKYNEIPDITKATYCWYAKESVDANCFNFSAYNGVYDGQEHPATVTAKTEMGVGAITSVTYYQEKSLEPMTGYPKDIGTYIVKVTGQVGDSYSEYTDFTSVYWRVVINPIPLDNSMIYGLEESYEYQGQQICPNISIKVTESSEPLVEGVDYTVHYGSNLDAGDNAGIVAVTGIGKFTGVFNATFNITKAKNKITEINIDDIYFNQYPHPTLKAKFGTEGKFEYSSNKEGPYGVWETANPPGQYWVKATVFGTDNWEEASDVKSFNVNTRDMEVSVSSYVYTYDKEEHLLGVVDVTEPSGGVANIMYSETEGGPYDLLEVPSKVEAGTYTVYFKATATSYNDYYGSFSCTIKPKEIKVLSGIKAIDRQCNFTTDVDLDVTGAVTEDLLGDDQAHVSSAKGTMDDYKAGINKTVHITDIKFEGPQGHNYVGSEKEGQLTTTVNIMKADSSITPDSRTDFVYGTQEYLSYTQIGDGDVTAKSSNEQIFKTEVDKDNNRVKIIPVSVGNATITLYQAESESFAASSAEHNIVITPGTITAIGNPKSGLKYNRNDQVLGDVSTDVDNCTITYSVDGGEYTDAPLAKNAGTHNVKYKVNKQNYNQTAGEFNTTIDKAVPKDLLSDTGTYKTNCVTKIDIPYDGDGALSATSSNESVAKVSVEDSQLVVTSFNTGTATITLNVSEGTNYYATTESQAATVTTNPQYTVKFVTNCPTQLADQVVAWGDKVTEEKLTYPGNTFIGWYKDAEFILPYDFDEPVTSELTLFAKWELGEIVYPSDIDGVTIHKEGLENILAKLKTDYPTAKSVLLNMNFEKDKADVKDVEVITSNVSKSTLYLHTISLKATIDGNEIDIGDNNDINIDITYALPKDFNCQANAVRVHNGQFTNLPKSSEGNSEYVVFNSDENTATISACKYSTYGFAQPVVVPDKPGDSDSEKIMTASTADNNSIAWVSLLVLSCCCFAAGVYCIRKKPSFN